jgi:hypothetical protein
MSAFHPAPVSKPCTSLAGTMNTYSTDTVCLQGQLQVAPSHLDGTQVCLHSRHQLRVQGAVGGPESAVQAHIRPRQRPREFAAQVWGVLAVCIDDPVIVGRPVARAAADTAGCCCQGWQLLACMHGWPGQQGAPRAGQRH